MRILPLVVIALACGRIAFEPLEATGDGGVCLASELCNAIDDTCDGVVDEGCPCTPFERTFTDVGTRAVSTGAGYLIGNQFGAMSFLSDTGELTATPITEEHRITVGRYPLAWTGSDVAFLTPDARIQRVGLDGSIVATGPSLDARPDHRGILRWTGAGFDVLIGTGYFATPGPIAFVRTDAMGTPLAPAVTSAVHDVMYPEIIEQRGADTYLGWMQYDGAVGTSRLVKASEPLATALEIATAYGGPDEVDLVPDDSGRVLAIDVGDVRLFAGGILSPLDTMQHYIAKALWTGDGWLMPSSRNADLYAVRIDRSLAVTFEFLANATVIGGGAPTIVSDGHRVLFAKYYSSMIGTVFVQRCL